MNGLNSKTKLGPESFVTPKQQQLNKAKKEKRKFILCLILTNALTGLLVDFGSEQKAPRQVSQKIEEMPGHTRMSLPLRPFVPLNDGRQTVSLYNKQGQVIVQKAYLLPNQKEASSNTWSSATKTQEYSVLIPISQVSSLTAHSQDQLMAYPFNENSMDQSLDRYTTSKEKSYEIVF